MMEVVIIITLSGREFCCRGDMMEPSRILAFFLYLYLGDGYLYMELFIGQHLFFNFTICSFTLIKIRKSEETYSQETYSHSCAMIDILSICMMSLAGWCDKQNSSYDCFCACLFITFSLLPNIATIFLSSLCFVSNLSL